MNSKNNNEKRRPLHEMTSTSITVYRNGDRNFLGKKLVLNRKYIRNFDTFLDKVTCDTQAKVAVRSIRTPNNGTRILNLEKFENGGVYVAVGFERFKQLPYKDLRPNRLNPIKHVHQPQNVVYKPVLHSRIHASARHLKIADSEPLKNRIIYVYRNGDERFPGLKLLLDKRILQSMESVLQHITDKVKLRTGAVKSLYTVDGVLVKETRGLETGSRYIAVGYNRPFVKAMYTKRAGVFSITPRKHPNSIISNATNSPKKLKSAHQVPHKKKKATTKEKTKPPTQDDNPGETNDDILNELADNISANMNVLEMAPSPPLLPKPPSREASVVEPPESKRRVHARKKLREDDLKFDSEEGFFPEMPKNSKSELTFISDKGSKRPALSNKSSEESLLASKSVDEKSKGPTHVSLTEKDVAAVQNDSPKNTPVISPLIDSQTAVEARFSYDANNIAKLASPRNDDSFNESHATKSFGPNDNLHADKNNNNEIVLTRRSTDNSLVDNKTDNRGLVENREVNNENDSKINPDSPFNLKDYGEGVVNIHDTYSVKRQSKLDLKSLERINSPEPVPNENDKNLNTIDPVKSPKEVKKRKSSKNTRKSPVSRKSNDTKSISVTDDSNNNSVERGSEDLKLQYVKDQAFGGTFSRPADDVEKSKGKKKKGDEEGNVRENEEGVVTENPELPSVFQATGENKVFGTEVMEGQETHIEQTVEMMAAEEINDEEIDHPQQTTKKMSQVSEGKDGRSYTSP